MPAELKDFVVNLKSLSQDIKDPIIQGGGDANGRTLRIIFTQEAADMFTPDTKVYLYWNHQQLKTYGVNVFTRVSKKECCFNPPVWEIHWPKAMLHEGDVLCCIKLVDDVSISPSNNFLVHVLQDPNDGSSFVVGDDYSVFDKCVLEMNAATDKAKEQLQKQQEEFESMRQEFTTLKNDVQAALSNIQSFVYGEFDTFPKVGKENTLYATDNATYVWNTITGSYICIANKTEWKEA